MSKKIADEVDKAKLPGRQGITSTPHKVVNIDGTERATLDARDPMAKAYRIMDTKPIRDEFIIPCLLWLAVDLMEKEEGLTVRGDLIENLMRAAFKIVSNRGPFDQKKLAEYSMMHGQKIIKEMNAATTREAVLGICHMILHLADEAIIETPDQLAVLSALAILTEAEEDGKTGSWKYDRARVVAAGSRAYEHARHIGYF